MTLREVTPGSTVKVTKLTGEGPVKRRIMDMGITAIRVTRKRNRNSHFFFSFSKFDISILYLF